MITLGDARDVPIDQLRTFFTVSSTSANVWPHGDGVSAAYNFSLTWAIVILTFDARVAATGNAVIIALDLFYRARKH